MPSQVFVVLLLLALMLPVPGQSAQQQPTFGTGTTAVVVDVVVRDRRGDPVTDLQKNNFELLEDGVRQEIADATLVARFSTSVSCGSERNDGTVEATSPATVRAPAFVALVFDRLSPEARAAATKGAKAALETMSASDFFGVFVADLSLHTLQTFTNDRSLVERALDEASTRSTAVFSEEADRVRGAGYTSSAEFSGPRLRASEGPGPSGEFARMTGRMEVTYELLSRDHQGFTTTNSLLALVSSFGQLPGRKSIVFFSESLALTMAVQARFEAVIQNANAANVAIYAVDAAGLRVRNDARRQMNCLNNIAPDCEDLTKYLGSGYDRTDLIVDLLRKDPTAALGTLSRATGGFLIENTNDLARGFQRIDADRRFHYLLTYTPKNDHFDGGWRKVTVRVPSRRVEVRARSGYLAVRAPGAIPFLAHEGPALAALDRHPRPSDLPINAQAFVFPADGEARVAVLASASASSLTFASDDNTFSSSFTILARIRDANDEVVRKASEPYRLNGPLSNKEQAQKSEVLFFRQPTLPSGSYTLDVALHDAIAKKAGVVSRSFQVRESKGIGVSSLIVVGRGARVSEPQKDNPLYVRDVLIYPNLGEPISKKDGAVTLFLTVVPVAGRMPSAELELLRDGAVLAKVPLSFAAPVEDRIQQLWRVPVEALDPGEYTFRIIVADGQSRETRERILRFVN